MTTFASNSTHNISVHSLRAIILTRIGDDGEPTVKKRWAQALESRGMEVVYADPSSDFDKKLDSADMVLLTGDDSHHPPEHFNGSYNVPILAEDHYDRDFSYASILLAKKAYEKRIPTLGVCFGFQAMYLALGGSGLQRTEGSKHEHWHGLSAPKNKHGEPDIEHLNKPVVPVIFSEDSRYKRHFNLNAVTTNAAHKYGVRLDVWNSDDNISVRERLTIDAASDDGWAKAFSASDRPFYGVQWHAELPGRENEVFMDLVVEDAAEYTQQKYALLSVEQGRLEPVLA